MQSCGIVSSRGYSGNGYRQLHWRMWQPADASPQAPDLYCFHPAPFSGMSYDKIAPLLAEGRRVIAPDYPGYGGSDALGSEPAIADYAAAMKAVIDDLSEGMSEDRAVDVLGFHTGCLVAVELAALSSAAVRKACLIDIPAMDAETSARMVEQHKGAIPLSEDIASIQPIWDSTFVKRIEAQGVEQSFALFAEHLRAGIMANQAFAAAFAYPWEERFPSHAHETLVIASQSMLLDGTIRAAGLLPNAKLVERRDITRFVLDEAASLTAQEVLNFLGS